MSREEFLIPLRIDVDGTGVVDAVANRGVWKAGLVVFSDRRLSDFESEPEPDEAFMAAVGVDLNQLGRWLAKRHIELSKVRADGLRLDIYIGLHIDQGQMELCLPAPLLLQCGHLGLDIQTITND